ncbi:MAG TPA: aminotransferase class V-fold PLP-dependent enzyme [Acidimicrobiales bacterium]|nr:aminotransferase class V-fold PLP-dependent enzyme [Acidimicrobiales bacterium]
MTVDTSPASTSAAALPGPEWPAGLELIGLDTEVPLVDGHVVRAVDLDRAATTPCLVAVKQAVDELLPYYGAPHRGAGYKSLVTTRAFEHARHAVGRFVGAGDEHAVVFVRNTTEACNLLASQLAGSCDVVVFDLEHHADLLPWRRLGAQVLPVPAGAAELLEALSAAVARRGRDDLVVALTGISNVTGEVMPLAEAAAIVHDAGGRLFVDAAQLAPHLPIDMVATGIDFLALSGHKLYAPFGSGALVGCRDWLERGEPMLLGGGAPVLVTDETVVWKPVPDRLEAGTANVTGAIALGAACDRLAAAGMSTIAAIERGLVERLDALLAAVPGLDRLLMLGEGHDHAGVACFTLSDLPHGLVAAALSAEHGIGVRSGCFCAHGLVRELMGISRADAASVAQRLDCGESVPLPGAVRVSVGIGSSFEDLERLSSALQQLASGGPRWHYRQLSGDGPYEPDPDPRPVVALGGAARSN